MRYTKHENEKKRRAIKSHAKRLKNKTALMILRAVTAVIIIACFVLGGTGLGIYLGILEKTPKLSFETKITGSFDTIFYLDSTGEEVDRFSSGENREYVPFEKIPKVLIDAFVSYEDERFYEHNGIDIKGLFRTIYVLVVSQEEIGASTITQQVIKNKLNILKNNYETKLQEQYLAIQYEEALIEQLGSKEEAKNYILEVYLNSIGLGDGQVGVQAASLHYFGKDVEEVNLSEAAVLAGITQHPIKYSPTKNPENNAERRKVILKKMEELGYISAKEHRDALADDVYAAISSISKASEDSPSYHSYFNEAVQQQVVKDLMEQKGMTKSEANNYFFNGGLSVYTTQDLEIQDIVDKNYLDEDNFPTNEFAIAVEYNISILNNVTGKTDHYQKKTLVKTLEEAEAFIEKVKNELGGLEKEIIADKAYFTPQPQSSFVVIDHSNGQVKAIAGARGEKTTDKPLNRATQAFRQPGSVFKVAASYLPAFDLGMINAATVYDDTPVTYPQYADWAPSNWDRNNPYQGLTTVREAITKSMNIIAVKNMMNTGINNSMNYLLNFGFSKIGDDNYVPSTALGAVDVSALELASAFASFANEGYYNEPILYTKVLDHDGAIVLENHTEPRQVMRKTTAYIITDIMKDVLTGVGGTGGSARFSQVKMPISGKTGTSSEDRDLTFVGSTPYYTAAVWLGFDLSKPMKNYGSVHLKLWSKIMEEVHQELPYKDFEKPNGITTAEICMESGKLKVEGLCDHDPRGNRTRSEIFELGTVPTEYCDIHMSFSVDRTSGKIAAANCPAEDVVRLVGIHRHEPYEGEHKELIQDMQYEIPAVLLAGVTCDLHSGLHNPTETENPFMPPASEEPYNPYLPPASEEPYNPYLPPASEEPYNPYLPPGPTQLVIPPDRTAAPTSQPDRTEPPYTPPQTNAPPDVTMRP